MPSRSRWSVVVACVASVVVPVLTGVAVVYALVPLDPPDLGWGHVATHVVPAGVVLGIVLLGRRWWPVPAGRAAGRARRLLKGSLVLVAAAQAGEAAAALAGQHDGAWHTAPMVVGALALPAVLGAVALTVCVALLDRLRARRRPTLSPAASAAGA